MLHPPGENGLVSQLTFAGNIKGHLAAVNETLQSLTVSHSTGNTAPSANFGKHSARRSKFAEQIPHTPSD